MNAYTTPPVSPSTTAGDVPVASMVRGASLETVIQDVGTGKGWGTKRWRLQGRRISVGFLAEVKPEKAERAEATTTGGIRPPWGTDNHTKVLGCPPRQ